MGAMRIESAHYRASGRMPHRQDRTRDLACQRGRSALTYRMILVGGTRVGVDEASQGNPGGQLLLLGSMGGSRANPEPTTSHAAERGSRAIALVERCCVEANGDTMPLEALAYTHEFIFSGAELVIGWLQT